MQAHGSVSDLADSILYVSSLLRDRPRPIDRYIDYFGDAGGTAHAAAGAAVGRGRPA
jgi:hypothetical protein